MGRLRARLQSSEVTKRDVGRAVGATAEDVERELHRLRLGVPLVEPGRDLGRQVGIEAGAAPAAEIGEQGTGVAAGRGVGPAGQFGVETEAVVGPCAARTGRGGVGRGSRRRRPATRPRDRPSGRSRTRRPRPARDGWRAHVGHQVAEHAVGGVDQIGVAVGVGPEVQHRTHGPVVHREVLAEDDGAAELFGEAAGVGAVHARGDDRRTGPQHRDVVEQRLRRTPSGTAWRRAWRSRWGT